MVFVIYSEYDGYGYLVLLLLTIINIPWVEQSTSVSFDDALVAALEDWDTVEPCVGEIDASSRSLNLNPGFSLWR